MDLTPSPHPNVYDRISRVYDLIADASEHAAREAGLQALGPAEGDAVLEIGCGTGRALVELAERVGQGGRVVGLDLSQGMLAVAQRRIASAGAGRRIELRSGDARSLPFAAGEFDAVFMSFTLELFEPEDLLRVLAEARRVLRPGGRLGVVSLALREPVNIATEIYIWLHRHFPHFIDCRPIAAETLITEAGFEVRQALEMSIWSLPVVAVVADAGHSGAN